MVRNPRLLFARWLSGADIHSSINKRGIAGNYLRIVRLRVAERILRFTDRSRPSNDV